MGISFSIPCDPCINKLFHGLEEKVDYTHNLQKNLVVLTTTMEELRAKRDDLLRRITREEDRGQQRLAQVSIWLTKVVNMESRVDGLFTNRDVQLQRLCLCGFCSKSLKLSYRYGKSVLLTLREAEELKNEVYKVIAERGQIEVQERQLQPIIVGQATMLDKAWKHLREDEVGITGMYGMGGVGKTTLLKQINNKFREERFGFDFVIWVVVSKELHIEKIQDEITRQVGLGGEEWKQKEKSQKADVIYNFLRKKKFVLFLDDLWEKVDLTEIGVPFPTTQNGCKVAFTTRSQDVCAHMGIEDPMEVQCLGENDAFDLFQRKVGKITLRSDPEIPNLARIVARKCSGLPLALNVIGETMSCKRTVQEWRHAIDVLTSYAAEFSGMEDKILPLLKYSYDNIKEEHYKSCLLYCSLFPEDYSIPKERLIEYLICEGIVDGSRGIERAENKGYEIIGGLVRASLLIEGVDEWGRAVSVFLHDVVREMALWIATDLGIEKEAYIVRASVGLDEMPKVKNWNVVRRMSLMNNKILRLAGSPQCLELTTLLLKNNSLKNISSEFFQYMPKLAVLNLSYNGRISELPEGISELVSLRYLDLSNTGIRYLPTGLKVLENLIHLDLEYTRSLSSIDGISMVQNLKVLKLTESGFTWDLNTMKELVTLEHLETLTTGFNLPQPMKQFLCFRKLTSCTQYLRIWDNDMESSGISLPVTMDKLRDFVIQNCTISEIKMGTISSKSKTGSPQQNPRNTFSSLTTVRIRGCERLRELTLLMFASNLKVLTVSFANQLEDIINREKASRGEASGIVPFPNLINLALNFLPKLKSIYWRTLPLPCLKQIDVDKCPNLKKLPLDSHSGMHGGENGLVIRYREKEWIESVEWEDEATETHFLSSCKKI